MLSYSKIFTLLLLVIAIFSGLLYKYEIAVKKIKEQELILKQNEFEIHAQRTIINEQGILITKNSDIVKNSNRIRGEIQNAKTPEEIQNIEYGIINKINCNIREFNSDIIC
jgi:hypothetical protein